MSMMKAGGAAIILALWIVLTASSATAQQPLFAITVDARSLGAVEWNLNAGRAGRGNNTSLTEVHLQSGRYDFCSLLQDCFSFTVTDEGVVDYDSVFNFLSGRGSRTLTVTGFPITIDARALSAIAWNLDAGWAGNGSNTASKTVNLIPGEYRFCSLLQDCFSFAVTVNGVIDYELALTFLSGKGSNTLTVQGVQVTIDTRVLASTRWQLDGGYAGVGDNIAPSSVRLVPGEYRLCAAYQDCFSFIVTIDSVPNRGKVEFDPALDTFVWGRGGDLMIVVGFPIIIDARLLGTESWNLEGTYAGVYPKAEVKTIRLLPGEYRFCADTHCFLFEVNGAGAVTHADSTGCINVTPANRLTLSCNP